ncbi:MFS transporter [Paraburkholderia xenovorans]
MNRSPVITEQRSENELQGGEVKRVLAASIGTLFEWYDFVLYGSLATVLSSKFFSGLDPTVAFVFTLLTFAVGFIIRPVGGLVFGRLGDRVGRKKTFLITMVLMGLGSIGVGILPTYSTLGIAAPILLISLRLLQGMALGGEYGGAITYIAESSPIRKRAFNTSWISATGTVGLLLSFLVILATRWLTGDKFEVYGWRIPFLFSIVLLVVSIKIRVSMHESPFFEQLRAKRALSKAPVLETFLQFQNFRRIVLAFFLVSGMTCVYYMATLYPIFFLTQTVKAEPSNVNLIVTGASVLCIPFFPMIGWLCDRVGRKPVMLVAYIVMALAIFPVFKTFSVVANPELAQAQATTPVVLETGSAECSFLFNPLGTAHFNSPCDIARRALSAFGISYDTLKTSQSGAKVSIGSQTVYLEGNDVSGAKTVNERSAEFSREVRVALTAAGYPETVKPAAMSSAWIFMLTFALLLCAVSIVTPISAVLVELFPTRIRYTAISAPYNFATGWVGGLLPTVVFAVSAQTGNVFAGLWYPIGWILFAALVCLLFYRETKDRDLNAIS